MRSRVRFSKTFFSFTASAFLACIAFSFAPNGASAENIALLDTPHPSDIKPEQAKKIPSEETLKLNLHEAIRKLNEASVSFLQVQSAHKKGNATLDEVSTHKTALNQAIEGVDDEIKQLESVPKSAAHEKMLKKAKAQKAKGEKILSNAQSVSAS